jgi:hypothetical protein
VSAVNGKIPENNSCVAILETPVGAPYESV